MVATSATIDQTKRNSRLWNLANRCIYGCDANDRHSETYKADVRPLEYQCLLESILANVECGISTVATAPFIAEMTSPVWMRRLVNRCAAYKVEVTPIWLECDADSMREYIAFRSAARDAWKLSNWTEYLDGLDLSLRPAVPHLTVDNRFGSAIAVRAMLRTCGSAPGGTRRAYLPE
jgi:hypothetical protein